jgi:hypothetical protein
MGASHTVVIASEAKQPIGAAKQKAGLLRRFRLRSLSYGRQVAPRNDVEYDSAIPRRDAPERCTKRFAQRREGAEKAGCPLHQKPRVQMVSKAHERRHHRSTGLTRPSLRNGFNGFLRALPGDRALLSPSSRGLRFCPRPIGPTKPPQDLTPASRRQNHTTSPSAISISRLRAVDRS